MKLDPAAQRRFAVEVLTQLREAGFTAYWAGGCVRDELLGRTPKDYDVASNARPEQVRELFGRRRTLAVGEAFGVIVVVGPKPAGTVEVTAFRRDATYSDGRRPDAVEYTDAEEDARRRDFTINALFFDPIENQVIDFVDGQADLQRGVVRAVGHAAERFQEDKLRMLRAVRMAARFGFTIDADTMAAVRASAHDIVIVSPERVAQELHGMLGRAGQATAAELMLSTGLAEAVLPEVAELSNAAHPDGGTRWERTVEILKQLELIGDHLFATALAALLHEVGHEADGDEPAAAARAAEAARAIGRRLRLSNDDREATMWLLQHRCALFDAAEKPWSQLQPVLAHRWGAELVRLHGAVIAASSRPTQDVEFCRDKLELPRELLDPSPLVDGNDLRARGLAPGPEFARILQALRAAQLDGQVVDKAAALRLVDDLRTRS